MPTPPGHAVRRTSRSRPRTATIRARCLTSLLAGALLLTEAAWAGGAPAPRDSSAAARAGASAPSHAGRPKPAQSGRSGQARDGRTVAKPAGKSRKSDGTKSTHARKKKHKKPRYREVGVASFYGRECKGRRTANGERFDPSKLTAAHRTLPFDTHVRVTNLDNGRRIVVRINDRGPYARGRVIDLSRAAARRLGFAEDGVARVRLEILRDSRGWRDPLASEPRARKGKTARKPGDAPERRGATRKGSSPRA